MKIRKPEILRNRKETIRPESGRADSCQELHKGRSISESGRIQQAFFCREEIIIQPRKVVFFSNGSEDCCTGERNKRRHKVQVTYTIDIERWQAWMLGCFGMFRIGRIVHHQKIPNIKVFGCVSFVLVVMRHQFRKFNVLTPVNFRNQAT